MVGSLSVRSECDSIDSSVPNIYADTNMAMPMVNMVGYVLFIEIACSGEAQHARLAQTLTQ